MERRSADGSKKDILESVRPPVSDVPKRCRLCSGIGGKRCVAGGAKKSERDPVRSRAMVEVKAIVVTWVDGRPAGGGARGE